MATAAEFDRIPPQDLDAEAATLGSMMLSKEAINDVAEIIKGSDYYLPAHEIIHDTIIDLAGRGEPADPITVSAELQRAGKLARVGGPTFLHDLIASVSTAANADYYARIVAERSTLRSLVTAGTRIAQLGYAEDGGDVDQIVNQAQEEVYSITNESDSRDYVSMGDLSESLIAELEEIETNKGKLHGVPTGFVDLDKLTQGLHPGQMIIVAGRPAMGKSTLSLDFCRNASIRHGITSVIFSLEMSSSEIAMRLLSAESGVFLSKMRAGDMEERDWMKVSQTVARVSEAPLFVDDSGDITMPHIRSKCRKLKQQHNLGLIVVDYLQLMTSGRQVDSREQEVAAFSRQLKMLARSLEVPIVAVAQLNRGPEQRNDKRPMMADLRESGSLEQDADVIMLLYRPDVYNEDDRPGEADIIVAKHRNGATKTVPALFQGHLSRFANRTSREEVGTHAPQRSNGS